MIWPTLRSGSGALVDDLQAEALTTDDSEARDLDPHRTVTYLVDGVPHCYMGHAHCYDTHTTERLTDEADYLEDLERG